MRREKAGALSSSSGGPSSPSSPALVFASNGKASAGGKATGKNGLLNHHSPDEPTKAKSTQAPRMIAETPAQRQVEDCDNKSTEDPHVPVSDGFLYNLVVGNGLRLPSSSSSASSSSRNHDVSSSATVCSLFTFESLPEELVLHVLSFLTAKELCVLSYVTKKWQRLAEDDYLWSGLYYLRFVKNRMDLTLGEALQQFGAPKVKKPDKWAQKRWKTVFRHIHSGEFWKARKYCVTSIQSPQHSSDVSRIRFNETKMITASYDSTLRIWDTETLNCLDTLAGHTRNVTDLQFDDEKVISTSYDTTIRIWDINNGQCARVLKGHTDFVWCLQYQDNLLVTGSFDKTIKGWDLITGACIFTLHGHISQVYHLRFDRNTLISGAGTADRTIKVWDLRTEKCVKNIQGHEKYVYYLSLDLDDDLVTSGSGDYTIRQWDLRTGNNLRILRHHSNSVWGFQHDFKKIVSCSEGNHTVRICDYETGKCFKTLRGHTGGVWGVQFDDNKIVSVGTSRMVQIWRPDWDGLNGGELGGDNDEKKDEYQRIEARGPEVIKDPSADPPPEVVEKVTPKAKPSSSSKCRIA